MAVALSICKELQPCRPGGLGALVPQSAGVGDDQRVIVDNPLSIEKVTELFADDGRIILR